MSNTKRRKAPAGFLMLVKLLKRWVIINRVKSLVWRRCHFKTCLLNFFLPKKPTNSFTILDFFFNSFDLSFCILLLVQTFLEAKAQFSLPRSNSFAVYWLRSGSTTGSFSRRARTGSIVRLKAALLSCKLVKQVSQQCAGVVPKSFHLDHRWLHLNGNNLFYYFDGDTRGDWHMWDSPC